MRTRLWRIRFTMYPEQGEVTEVALFLFSLCFA